MARITFANDYTTPGGRSYKAGSTHDVNDGDARSLIFRGKARPEDSTPAAPKQVTNEEATHG
jgi:hypothetical protein